MCRRLVCDDIGNDAALREFRVHIGGIADQTDGFRRAALNVLFHERHGFFEVIHDHIHIADRATAFGAFGVHFHDQPHTFVHGDRERLSAAHATESRREDELAFERSPAFELGKRAKGFVRALQDPLRADIDP